MSIVVDILTGIAELVALFFILCGVVGGMWITWQEIQNMR